MSERVVVSLDGITAKVVYASAKGGGLTEVKDALNLPDGQLDAYLGNERVQEITVVNHFRESFHDLINIPAAKKRYIRKIIELEIGKRCQFDGFEFIFFIAGEKVSEERRSLDVFVYAVRSEEVNNLIRRFSDKGKTVKAVYPDIFVLNHQLGRTPKPVLCVLEAGAGKTIFLSKDGVVVFARDAISGGGGGLDHFDSQNIDMTVNYCRQSLRITPSLIMLAGRLAGSEIRASQPLACLLPHAKAAASREVVLDFTTPLSALRTPRSVDISPQEYRLSKVKTTLLRYSAAAFAALTVVIAAYSVLAFNGLAAAREKFDEAMKSLSAADAVLEEYGREKGELESFRPFIKTFNDSASAPDSQAFFHALPGLLTENIYFNLVSVTPEKETLKCRFEGTVKSSTYAGAQATFEKFVASFGRMEGASVTKQAFMLKDKAFLVEVEYR